MNVLVVNAGSSSLKYQLINVETRDVLAKGACERIGLGDSVFSSETAGRSSELVLPIPNHRTAISLVLGTVLQGGGQGRGSTPSGTASFTAAPISPTRAWWTTRSSARSRRSHPLAPLHNYAAASVIEACREVLPNVPNVVSFDTSFHATIPEVAWRYALPYDLCERFNLRKYGFHGINHRYVAMTVDSLTGGQARRVISCHLGNGSSLCAIERRARPIDTTMGFTPLDGLMMGTRCGSIDPAAVTFVLENSDLTAREVDTVMNKKSGLLAVSRPHQRHPRPSSTRPRAATTARSLAIDMFVYSARKHRRAPCGRLWAGLTPSSSRRAPGRTPPVIRRQGHSSRLAAAWALSLDPAKNAERHGEPWSIAAEGSRVRILVVPAGEEYMIALDVRRILG